MTLRPATFIYNTYGIPRAALRDMAERGAVYSEERLSIDGVNMMRLYDIDALEARLSAPHPNDGGNDER